MPTLIYKAERQKVRYFVEFPTKFKCLQLMVHPLLTSNKENLKNFHKDLEKEIFIPFRNSETNNEEGLRYLVESFEPIYYVIKSHDDLVEKWNKTQRNPKQREYTDSEENEIYRTEFYVREDGKIKIFKRHQHNVGPPQHDNDTNHPDINNNN